MVASTQCGSLFAAGEYLRTIIGSGAADASTRWGTCSDSTASILRLVTSIELLFELKLTGVA